MKTIVLVLVALAGLTTLVCMGYGPWRYQSVTRDMTPMVVDTWTGTVWCVREDKPATKLEGPAWTWLTGK